MATLPQKSFETLVSDMVTAWAVQMGINPVFQSGDPLLAILQSVATQLLFIQAQVQIVNLVARAQTSTGADLDTFYGQFNFPRLQGSSPSGTETFGKNSPAVSQVIVPAAVVGPNGGYAGGAIVQTPGGAIQYQVIPDSTQSAYNPTLNAYVLNPSQSSMAVTVAALAPGSSSNVSAGQLSQLGTVTAGIDYVTNPGAIANGVAPESDSAYSARFILYLASLSKATEAAITEAVESVQPGIQFQLYENVDVSDDVRLGEFVAVVGDGSETPPDNLVNLTQAAINAVRGFTILAEAKKYTSVQPPIVLNIRVAADFDGPTVEGLVANAVVAAVNISPIGGTLFINATIEDAAATVPGVVSVQPGTTINGVNADYAVAAMHAARITTSNVTVGSY